MPNIKEVGQEKGSLDSGYFAAYALKVMRDSGGNFENLQMSQADVYVARDAFPGYGGEPGNAGHEWVDEVKAIAFVKKLGLTHYDGEFALTIFGDTKKLAEYLLGSLAREGGYGIMVLEKSTSAHWVSILGRKGDEIYVYDPERSDEPRVAWVNTSSFVETLGKNLVAAVVAPKRGSNGVSSVSAKTGDIDLTFFQVEQPDWVGYPGDKLERAGVETALTLECGVIEDAGAASNGGTAQDKSRKLESNWEIHQDKGDSDCGPSCAAFLRYGGSRSEVAPKEAGTPVTIDRIQELCTTMRQETSASQAQEQMAGGLDHSDGVNTDVKAEILDEFAAVAKVYEGGKLKPEENPKPVRHRIKRRKFKAGSVIDGGRAWTPAIQIIGHLQELANTDARGAGVSVGIVSIGGARRWPIAGEPDMEWPHINGHAVVFLDCGNVTENEAGESVFTPLVFAKDNDGKYHTDQSAFETASVRYFCPGYSTDSTLNTGPDVMQASFFAFLHACRHQRGPLDPDPCFFQKEHDRDYAYSVAVQAVTAPDDWFVKRGDVLGELGLKAEPHNRLAIVATSDGWHYDNPKEADADAHARDTSVLVVESPPGTFSVVSIKDADADNPNDANWMDTVLQALAGKGAAAKVAHAADEFRNWMNPKGTFLCRNWAYVGSIRGWLGVSVGGKKDFWKIDCVWENSHRPEEPNQLNVIRWAIERSE